MPRGQWFACLKDAYSNEIVVQATMDCASDDALVVVIEEVAAEPWLLLPDQDWVPRRVFVTNELNMMVKS